MNYGDTRGRRFVMPGRTQNAGTAIFRGIDPYPGPKSGPRLLYSVDGARNPTWLQGECQYFTNITHIRHISSSTIHNVCVLRPLNWAVVSVAGAINTTAFTLDKNPGAYSTAFSYPVGGGNLQANITAPTVPVNVANLTPTTTHYFATQLADGTWFYDLIAGFNTSTLVVTTTTTIPNVTGGGIPKGAIFFLLGSLTTVDPNTGQVPPNWNTTVSTTEDWADSGGDCVVTSVHPGDPMCFLNPNATGQDYLNLISGYYGRE